ncbi:filamentous hemagglutinin [Pandoraea sp. SD6-2]|nr:filamentous hemagglutinin [Pandoraea sp. SD6-2]
MYARGTTVREMQGFVLKQYGTEVSSEFISSVTDEVMSDVTAWQPRPLEPMYPVAFFDALRLTAEDRTLLVQLDSVTSPGVQEDLREYVVNNYFVRNGYKPLEGKCGANNCFDGVYVKGDTIHLVEVKPLKSDGSVKLNGPSDGFPTQMSQDWVENAVSRLYKGTAKQRATADVIMSALGNGKVMKIVTGADRKGITAVKIK